MKYQLLIISALLALSACGKQEAANETVEVAPPAEQQVVTEAVEPTTPDEAPVAEAQEVVAESAAEPESGEQEILLAQADSVPAVQDWQFEEGVNYMRLVPTQPTVGGADKVEVAEFFWYGCPHCYTYESLINPWADGKPANVRFVRIPAMWNGLVQLHARLYYTEEVLVRNGVIKDAAAFRAGVFQEFHDRRNQMANVGAIEKVFQRFGVSSEDFNRTWKSFEVDQKLRVADDLARRYGISNVPAMVVNGKYRAGAAEAGSYPKLIELMDELVVRESIR